MKNRLKQNSLLRAWALLIFLLHQSYVLYSTGWSFFQNVNLVFHEAGHALFLWTPRMLMVFMGSGFEVMLPMAIAIYAYFKKKQLIVIFALWWTGTALWSAGVYISDALERSLPLIGGLDDTYHDWYVLLLEWKLLYSSELIGLHVYFLGSLFVGFSLGYLTYYIYKNTLQ